MKDSVALKNRKLLVQLFNLVYHKVEQMTSHPQEKKRKIDSRLYKVFRQSLWALLFKPSLRLKDLSRIVKRRAKSVKTASARLSYFLNQSPFPMREVGRSWVRESLRLLPPEALRWYQGKVIAILDPTAYIKRSRRGKKGREMQYVSWVLDSRTKKKGKGYLDIWAGLALKKGEVLPLTRHLFSSSFPDPSSFFQNQVEEKVIKEIFQLLEGEGYEVILVGDRGLSHEERLIRLSREGKSFVMRVRGDIKVEDEKGEKERIDSLLRKQKSLGEGKWKEEKESEVKGELRVLRGKISFSRSGRKGDREEAWLTFVGLFPEEEKKEPLILATTFSVKDQREAQEIVKIYELRWGIETMLEVLKGWGLEKFMVRKWEGIERACWLMMLAYLILIAALILKRLRSLRNEAVKLLKKLSVIKGQLTLGKLREAIGLDWEEHRRAWRNLQVQV